MTVYLSEAIDEFLEEKRRYSEIGHLSTDYVRNMKRAVDELIRFLGDRPVDQIRPREVTKLVEAADLGEVSANKTFLANHLRPFCNWMVDDAEYTSRSLYQSNSQKMKRAKKPSKVGGTYMSPEQIGMMYRFGHPFTRFLLLTGVRNSLGRELKLDWFDFGDRIIWVPPYTKGLKDKRADAALPWALPFTRPVLNLIPRGNTGLVFPGRKPDRPYDDSSAMKTTRKWARGHLDGIVYHDVRNTMVTWARNRGWSKDVAENALSHRQAYYDRATFIEERREMMQDWNRYVLNECVPASRSLISGEWSKAAQH